MRWTTLAVCAAVIGLLAVQSRSATVFEDSFDDARQTRDNWIVAYGNPQDTTVESGQFVVRSSAGDGASPTILTHDGAFDDFTYSVRLSSLTQEYGNVGILFSWQNTFEGYMFIVTSNKQFMLLKYEREGNTVSPKRLLLEWNSFIADTDNELTVSREGDQINLFCNGVLLASHQDTSFKQGGVGLVVGANEAVAFEDAYVTDIPLPTTTKSYFSDNFEDGELFGWRVFTNAGTIDEDGGALTINTSDAQGTGSTILFTDGSYRDVPVRAVVTRTSGSTEAFYGLILVQNEVSIADNSPVQSFDTSYVFQIRGDRNYGAYILLTNTQTSFSPLQSSAIRGNTDTLEITADYKFVVNGDTLPNVSFGHGQDFNGVGLVVDPGVNVTVDEFSVGDSTTNVTHFRDIAQSGRRARPSYLLGGTGIIYDPRGRAIGQVKDGAKGADSLRNLGAGLYFVIRKDGSTYLGRKAIVNVK
jgi:hypothetical protein